ncbi:MAG: hypothetical protein BGP13_22700 [Sphingobacteriales bacterium 40-81]|nr:MAG: hypothetical protein BGP13_22700 [Sphingobacteriales bacterium 40-81]
MSVLLISITAAAQQTKTDTTRQQADSSYKALLDAYGGRITYKQMMDTTGKSKMMQDYGMRIYDPRIGRYIPPEPKQNAAPNPNAYTNKEPVKKKPGNKSKEK